VEIAVDKGKRRKTPWVIGSLMVASLALLFILQSTNLWKDFTIDSSSDLILLYALSSFNFVAFVIFAFIFLRSITKLVRERRTFQLGAQIKTRLLIYFFALSLLPIIAMAVFSYLFMNRALERWFTQIPENAIREAREVQKQSLADRFSRLEESAKMLASSIQTRDLRADELAQIARAGNLVHISIFSDSKGVISAYDRPVSREDAAEIARIVTAAGSADHSDPSLSDGRWFDAAVAPLPAGRRLMVIPEPVDERGVSQIVENSVGEFELLKEKQIVIRRVGLLTLGVLTFMLIFASSWIAFHVARGITMPIKALAEGADEIAKGNLGHRVDVLAEDELALLVSTFNDMSSKLESNSHELERRRRYIETVLETLPTGVISFDADNRVSTINRSAVEILRFEADTGRGAKLDEIILDPATAGGFTRILSRARRVGHASDQIKLQDRAEEGERTSEIIAAITATKFPADLGVVLVIEDLSDLIAAQRASAWQEVARRMAHEIKNPLTPIQLSAERIARRFAKATGNGNGEQKWGLENGQVGDFISESTATILREVASLKSMVDEFSQFARLPDLSIERGNLNSSISEAIAVFSENFRSVSIVKKLAENLPDTDLDTEQMKRVFINLIRNSIEAFDEKPNRPEVLVATRWDQARDLIIAEVSDNAKGIALPDVQKLFEPYFSTKRRGTGLGLAIVHRIVTDHKGRIKAVPNNPKGAKFIIEMPVNG
jgi:two-component system nitrogen regulation sensor histidine kinase NtrY